MTRWMCRAVSWRVRAVTMVVLASLLSPVASAQPVGCVYPARFPGENAPTSAIAAWMAARAIERGIPGELPVVAALVRSGLRNQPADHNGRAGYFGMLRQLWDPGPYAGFRDDPGIQIEWFVNQMIAIRDRAIFLGARHFGERPSQWGEWIALALVAGRPGVYEERLEDARSLITTGCSTPPPVACVFVGGYPGDDASQVDTASWMAGKAIEAGLPPELPIMAALVESGLKNLDYGDADSVGFFQMRKSIWNNGLFEDFPSEPELQIKWFIDHANAARTARIAAGDATFGHDPGQWGEWIADVQRPPEQFRGRYQLRLNDARQLIELACSE